MNSSIPIAVSAGSLYPLPTLKSIQQLKEIDVQDIELTLQSNEFFLTFERKLGMPILPELSALVESGELCVRSVHAPSISAERSGYNLQARLQLLMHSIEVCRLLGGRIVVVHPFHLFRVHEDALNYLSGNIPSLTTALLPGIDAAIELAHSANIKLALENIQDWVDEIFFNTPVSMAGFLRDINNPVFGCTLDLMHAQYPGVLKDFIELLAVDIVNIHAADLFPPTQRVAVGKGVIDWGRLAPKLQSLPNLQQVTVELSNPRSDDLLESVKFMAALMS